MKYPVLLLILLASFMILGATAGNAPAEEQKPELPPLRVAGEPYETPLAGEGFRATIFGKEVEVPPRDRRSISAWSVGFQVNVPEPEDTLIYPVGSLYLWRHPDEDTLFRAEIAGFYNRLLYATSPEYLGALEWVLTFKNFTVPFDQSPIVEGELLEDRELLWGDVNAGFGLGYRKQLEPGFQENMVGVALLIEPSYLYFSEGSDTADSYVVPQDTFELRGRLRMRMDKMVRNVLELPHQGFGLGTNLVYGHRFDWEDWGINGEFSGNNGEDYQYASGYFLAAGGVPFVDSERHRLVTTFHGALGEDLDRFSARRVGGGPQPMGQEYGSTARPVLPGAALREFYPEDYAILVAEYRFEALFFTYLTLRTSVSYLNRYELEGDRLERDGEYYASIGGGVTTGFFFGTRLQIDYNYNNSVIRDGDSGGSEVVFRLSNRF